LGVIFVTGLVLFGKKRARARAPAVVGAIIGRSGEFRGVSLAVPATGLVLGRDSAKDGHLSFSDDSDVSRRHCSIEFDSRTQLFRVVDLGSSNGTFTLPDEKRLTAHTIATLKPGEAIRLGRNNAFDLVSR
jgi:predicted component of type VI protein secretion system